MGARFRTAIFYPKKSKFQNFDGSTEKRRLLLSKPNVFDKNQSGTYMIEKFTNTTNTYGIGETCGMG